MPRQRRTCPLCHKCNLVKLSNHLSDVHHLDAEHRKPILEEAKRSYRIESSSELMKTLVDEIRALKVLISSGYNMSCKHTGCRRWVTL